jgi:spore coat protein A
LRYIRPSVLDPHEQGWKDVVRIAAGIETPGRGEMVSVVGQFGSGTTTGRYVYHCHLLEHEHGMMRPFVVLPAKVMALNTHGGGHSDHHGH